VSPPPPAGHAWDGGTRGWDVYYGVILLGVLALVIATAAQENQPAGARVITCAALAAMAPWYLLQRRSVLYGESSLARGMIYLAGLWILFIIASSQGIIETWVLLALGPQCFLAVPFRWAVGAIIALNVTPVAVALITGASPGELTSLIASGVLTVAFSVAFGYWVFRIIAQSYDRAGLIEQLSQTRAELAGANRRAGVLAERQRLSGEIHDTVAQGFTSIIMLLQAADADVERQPAAARGHLALALQTARENLAEARALVAALAPAGLEPGALGGALHRLAATMDGRLGTAARFDVAGLAVPLPRQAEVMLLRVAQEALANVRKHARARQVLVRLRYAEGQVGLEITDDGAGFDPGRPGGGYGLPGMRARADEAGGRLEVRSSPGGGTTVSVVVPVPDPAADPVACSAASGPAATPAPSALSATAAAPATPATPATRDGPPGQDEPAGQAGTA
jgi:signal transduction histidine kinase